MKTLFVVLSFIFLLSGCDTIVDENNSYDYTIEQKMDCFCPQANAWVKLYVNADTVSSAVRLSDNHFLNYNEFRYYKSIKGLFDQISEIDTSKYELEVIMDSKNNYPAYVYYNPKPIVVPGDTVVAVISDGQLSYTTRNYSKTD